MLNSFQVTCILLSVCLFGWWNSKNVPSSILPLGLLQGIICNIERLKGGTLEPWITRGTKIGGEPNLKGATPEPSYAHLKLHIEGSYTQLIQFWFNTSSPSVRFVVFTVSQPSGQFAIKWRYEPQQIKFIVSQPLFGFGFTDRLDLFFLGVKVVLLL